MQPGNRGQSNRNQQVWAGARRAGEGEALGMGGGFFGFMGFIMAQTFFACNLI
jgi:hypothetical protein